MKKRNWAFIMYLDSAPSNWEELILQSGLKCAVSPYHDKDINPTGEAKKAHYHVICCWENPTTYNNALNFAKQFGANEIKGLESVVGYYRYFTHRDNPEKYQYNQEETRHFNGFDPVELLTNSERLVIIKQLIILIKDKKIYQYEDLLFYLLENDLTEYFQIAVSSCYFIQQLLASRRCIRAISQKS